ncbi:MAG: 7TM diverse intracellular signaling domain-containing protein [Gammaproteobacteria bacterium]
MNTRVLTAKVLWSLAVYWIAVLWLPSAFASDIPTLDVARIHDRESIENFTVYTKDDSQHYTAAEILRGDVDRSLLHHDDQPFNFGISTATYWLLFQLQNTQTGSAPEQQDLLLNINYPPLDHITLHYLDETGQLISIASGDNLPFSQRPLPHNTYLFPLTVKPGEAKRFVLEVQSAGSIRVPMTLWHPDAFNRYNDHSLLLYGIYFGIILLMLLYNLILFLFSRDRSYLHYIFYIGSLALFQASYNGFAFQYLWPDVPALNNPLTSASLLLMLFGGCLFTRTILDTATTLPRLHRALGLLMLFFFGVILLLPVIPYERALNTAISVGIFSILIIISAGITNAVRGIRTARFFLAAWTCALMGGIILGCTAAGLLPVNAFTANAFILGTAIEITFLSLSLADRMNRIERERTKAEQLAKQALQDINRTLQESNRIKDEFLNTISHEMRTPMHGVLNSIQHLRSETDQARRAQFVEYAERAAQQMMMQIDCVLNYTELQSPDFVLLKEPFRISRLAESLDHLFRHQAQSAGLDFSISIDADVPELVIGDFRRIQQILINLLGNGIKFTQAGYVCLTVKVVTLDKQQQRTRLLFQVSDSGIGIPAEMETKVFDRFRQVQGGFNRGFGGLGIGLATSREICRRMEAELTYTSTPGQGTTFNLVAEFPYSPRAQQSGKDDSVHYDWQQIAANRLCLIVEDNPVNQMVLKASLNRLGLKTLLASNGEEALDLLQEHPVEIILMDCQMPVMDGFAATRAIRALEGDKALIPIIAITANAMSKDRDRCVEAGMNDYMSKPVDLHELKEKLLKWLPMVRRAPASANHNGGKPPQNVVDFSDKRNR